ncbi:MAG TPA: hypothetical protein VF680_16860 [Allosphingosinicella sp.]
MRGRINVVQQPRQRLPYKQKNKEWRKDNLDFADTHSFYFNEEVRNSLKNKSINLNIYNGIIDTEDLVSVVNPNHLDATYVAKQIPHHPIIVPKIDLLVGEEIKRRFDFYAVVTNPNAISKKEEDKKKFLIEKLTSFLEANYQEDELKLKMDELGKYMKYSWQDLREKMANQILKHYWQELNFAEKFSKGFKDALIMAEEIYLLDISHGEPVFEKLNPLKVHAVRSGNSDRIEDASMIIIEDYKSANQLVDEYYDELKTEEIDALLDRTTKTSKGEYSDDQNNHTLFRDNHTTIKGMYDSVFEIAELNGHTFGSNFTDENGNIRELRVRWKSLRQVLKVKYYDEYGETQYRFESEEYIVDKNMGEEATKFWVNEGWEGIKLGTDIYLKMRPLPVQYIKANNPSRGHLGIIGQIYNTNQGRAVSLVDRAKNFQYMYDAIFDRLNKAIASNYGKILELDLSKVPANWEIEKWMHFAVVNKIAVIDSFKEGNHGAATGKLAGSMNTQGGRVMDMETGSYIQQHIQLLEFIKVEMGELCGVSRQREGQIENRETVGGVERSVNQSSHVTEYWFMQHESVKIRVLEAFLETAKIALRSAENKKVQYILDDQTIEILNMEGEEFSENDYGILVSSTTKAMELEQAIKGYAQAFIQNGGSMSTIMDIYFSPSLMDMRRKLETAEEQLQQRNSEQAQEQSKVAREQMAAQAQLEQQKLELDDLKNQRDNNTKRYIAEINEKGGNLNPIDADNDGIADPLDNSKFRLDVEKARKDYEIKIKTLNQDMQKHEDAMEAKKVDQQINRIKKKSTT